MIAPVGPDAIVSAIMESPCGRILLLRQSSEHHGEVVSLPGGHVERGEDNLNALRREILEETGINAKPSDRDMVYRVITSGELHPRDVRVYRVAADAEAVLDFRGDPDGDIRGASWMEKSAAIDTLLSSPARHIAEPLVAHIAGLGHRLTWRYSSRTNLQESRDALAAWGGVIEGHFAIGEIHTDHLGVPAACLATPDRLWQVVETIAALLAPYEPEFVVSPAVGGVPFGTVAALMLGLPHTVLDPHDRTGMFHAARGPMPVGRVAIVDSTCHSTRTLSKVDEFIRSLGGSVVSSAVVVRTTSLDGQDDTPVRTYSRPATSPSRTLRFPVHAVTTLSVGSWSPRACPLCEAGRPLDAHPYRHPYPLARLVRS